MYLDLFKLNNFGRRRFCLFVSFCIGAATGGICLFCESVAPSGGRGENYAVVSPPFPSPLYRAVAYFSLLFSFFIYIF